MNLGDYEFVGANQEIVDECDLRNLRTEIARLRAENRELRDKLRALQVEGFLPFKVNKNV